MAEELEVKEITELNGVSFTDSTLILAYTEDEGVGKTTFADAKKCIGSDVNLEQTTTGTTPSAENVITATIRNGTQTETKTFSIKNGTGLSQATQTESTDADGLRSNAIALKSSDTTLVDDIEFTVKDGVGIKAHSTTEETDTAGLRKNTLAISLTDGTGESIEIKDGVGVKAHTVTEETDDNGRTKNTLAVTYTDGTGDSIEIKDGVGIKAHPLTESTDDNGLTTHNINFSYTDGTADSFDIKDGTGVKSHSITKSTDDNGLVKNSLSIAYTDGKTDSAAISDGVGIKSAEQTTSSTLSGELNEYTVKLTDGTESTIKVYNGRAGKDFRIKKTYSSVSEMQADFSGTDVDTYEFAMIDTGSVEDADTGKLYCKLEAEWSYIGDLSGRQGIKGDTGNGIASISNELTEEGKISVKITLTDGTETSFLINNGLQYTAGDNISISDKNVISADLSAKANASDVYTKTETDTKLGDKLDLSGGTMTGLLNAGSGLRIPTAAPASPQNGDIWIE